MNETMELPAVLDTSLAPKLLPIVKLRNNFGDFEEWEHSVRFYLRYHKLLAFIGEDEGGPIGYAQLKNDKSDDILHHRLFVYSLIWKSAEAVLCCMSSPIMAIGEALQHEVNQNSEHYPALLWEILRTHRDSVRNPKPLRSFDW